MSVLKNVKVESESNNKSFAKKVYMGAKADFPINKTVELRIINGSPSRILYMGKNSGCRSFDGEVGKTVESGYKDERFCDECDLKYGFKDEKGNEYKCKRQYTLYFEHDDPEMEYVLSISYGAQKNLDKYITALDAQGIDVDQVITGITRIENPDGPGTTYTFQKIRDLELKLSSEESDALDMLKSKAISTGSPIPVRFAAELLKNLASLRGISDEHALRLAESIAKDGFITGKSV